ncbi:MAG TPA: glycerophosphodiester phosphodiesterase, partial [Gaiellaceae bacterium]|nr:glycerophosphodiester phosphodiesterase [Gaiellaceae bacterium]
MIALARRGRRPLCIGHRGAAALAPENTLPSFRAAVAAGVDLVEFDVLGLHSGELVVAHSDDLGEVSHGAAAGTVRDRSLAALREVAPELPTLEDALGFFVDEAPGVGIHVDLKSQGSVDALVAVLRRFELVERTLVSSFHRGALRRLAALEPKLRAGVSFPEDRLGISHRR